MPIGAAVKTSVGRDGDATGHRSAGSHFFSARGRDDDGALCLLAAPVARLGV